MHKNEHLFYGTNDCLQFVVFWRCVVFMFQTIAQTEAASKERNLGVIATRQLGISNANMPFYGNLFAWC